MRKNLLRSFLLLTLGTTALTAQAQRRYDRGWMEPELSEPVGWSLGITTGLSDLWGDVGTKSVIDHYGNSEYWSNTKFMGGLYLRYAFKPAIAARLSANFGTLYANDNWNKSKAEGAENINDDAVQRYLRNQDVRSYVWEGSLMAEIMPFRFNSTSMMARRRVQPYLLAGVAAFNHRSQTTWRSRPGTAGGPGTNGGGHGQWEDMYELHLEGDGWNFDGAPPLSHRWNLAIPMGVGVRWELGKKLGLGLEYLFRYTFTDYIDCVSARYLPTAYYQAQLPADKAIKAQDMADKTWQVIGNDSYYHKAGEFRGDETTKDHYSTISLNFFYKINLRRKPWWF